MSKVTIIQRILPHYRKSFFVSLHRQLTHAGIQFQLIYGQEYPGTVPRSDLLEYPWAIRLENRYFNTPIGRFVWQPCLEHLQDSDLIIFEQANSLLVNYWLMIRRKFEIRRLAFWGHGRNFQARSKRTFGGEAKNWLMTQVDWWFAYTEASAKVVRESGFLADKITVVQNTIDTNELECALATVTQVNVSNIKAYLGLPNERVALYCGGMYADKQLEFLLAACKLVRQRIDDFHVIFIGHGPEQGKIEHAANEYDWIHYVGPKFGPERAVYFKVSKALLIPGLVGLAIVDSFIAQTPLFTTDIWCHSPEIVYLEQGVNGVMTPFEVRAYADSVAAFLESDEAQERLKKGCRQSAQIYTLDNMVRNFVIGIQDCLKAV